MHLKLNLCARKTHKDTIGELEKWTDILLIIKMVCFIAIIYYVFDEDWYNITV